MEKPAFFGRVVAGARELGLPLGEARLEALYWLAGELVRWSRRINLTAILDPTEIADKHILDSLALLRVRDPRVQALLDAGTGAGFPGLPLAIARDDLRVTLVDSVAKKVGFLKHAMRRHRCAAGRVVERVHRGLPRGTVSYEKPHSSRCSPGVSSREKSRAGVRHARIRRGAPRGAPPSSQRRQCVRRLSDCCGRTAGRGCASWWQSRRRWPRRARSAARRARRLRSATPATARYAPRSAASR